MAKQYNNKWKYTDVTAWFQKGMIDTNDNIKAYRESMDNTVMTPTSISCTCGCKDFRFTKHKTRANFVCMHCDNKIIIPRNQWRFFCLKSLRNG